MAAGCATSTSRGSSQPMTLNNGRGARPHFLEGMSVTSSWIFGWPQFGIFLQRLAQVPRRSATARLPPTERVLNRYLAGLRVFEWWQKRHRPRIVCLAIIIDRPVLRAGPIVEVFTCWACSPLAMRSTRRSVSRSPSYFRQTLTHASGCAVDSLPTGTSSPSIE